jgi:small subunit ribosomal protein S14
MASKSTFEKVKRIKELVAKYAAKRAELKKAGDWEALANLPRNSSATRIKRICRITGRSRAVYRKFGISRIMLRKLAHEGKIPGMKKSSW